MTDDYHVGIDKAAGIARQVWQEFSPRDGEELACRDDGTFEVTIRGEGTEGFDIAPDQPTGSFAAALADRLQAIFMEIRQQMVPGCPIHPGAHPLHSDVVNGAAAWACPSTQHPVRFIRVTGEAV